ncbi:MAG: hypothetical protein EOP48_20380 [Sphingobacteriales bacterium]|nr:MAG: hypothetical protein EOP48_20380 [Sphingobacteriales bacterium]
MRYLHLYLALIVYQISISSCSINKQLLEKSKSEFVTIKFYYQPKSQKNALGNRVLGIVDNKIFYSFYLDKIVKQTTQENNLIMALFDGDFPESYDATTFQKLSPLDSLILMRGNNLLDSLGFADYKNSNNGTAFEVEINYYHGYPKRKRLTPIQ